MHLPTGSAGGLWAKGGGAGRKSQVTFGNNSLARAILQLERRSSHTLYTPTWILYDPCQPARTGRAVLFFFFSNCTVQWKRGHSQRGRSALPVSGEEQYARQGGPGGRRLVTWTICAHKSLKSFDSSTGVLVPPPPPFFSFLATVRAGQCATLD